MGQKGHLLQVGQGEQCRVAWRAARPGTPASFLPNVVPVGNGVPIPAGSLGISVGRGGGATGQMAPRDVPREASEGAGTVDKGACSSPCYHHAWSVILAPILLAMVPIQ